MQLEARITELQARLDDLAADSEARAASSGVLTDAPPPSPDAQLRTLRELRESLAKADKPAAEQSFRLTVSALDKAIQKGVIHENTASRYKSRLSARVKALK